MITHNELAKKLAKSKAKITGAIRISNDIKFVDSSKTGHCEILEKEKEK